jgi:predicted nuclease of predicted toxin-antitoxin system
MKVKLDENVPGAVAGLLQARGHDVAAVAGEGLGGRQDSAVAQAAAQEGRMIITLDRRFADIRRYPPGTHPGILVLHARDQRPGLIEATMLALLDNYSLEDLTEAVVVAGLGAVRVRR